MSARLFSRYSLPGWMIYGQHPVWTVMTLMGPKVDAAIRFLEGGGRRVVIGHLDEALAALYGETGTHVTHDGT